MVEPRAFGQAGAQRQNRLGTIERLNLALLVYAQHQRFVRRIEVQADHIAQLGDEVGIGTELERFDQVRLKPVCPPNLVHHGSTDPLSAGHRAHTPVGGIGRLGLEGCLDNRRDARGGQLLAPARAGRVAQQSLNPGRAESFAPKGNRRPAHLELFGQPMVGCF